MEDLRKPSLVWNTFHPTSVPRVARHIHKGNPIDEEGLQLPAPARKMNMSY